MFFYWIPASSPSLYALTPYSILLYNNYKNKSSNLVCLNYIKENIHYYIFIIILQFFIFIHSSFTFIDYKCIVSEVFFLSRNEMVRVLIILLVVIRQICSGFWESKEKVMLWNDGRQRAISFSAYRWHRAIVKEKEKINEITDDYLGINHTSKNKDQLLSLMCHKK